MMYMELFVEDKKIYFVEGYRIDPDTGVSCPNYEKIATAFDFKYFKLKIKTN